MRLLLFSVTCALLQDTPVSAGTSQCRVQDNCMDIKRRRQTFYLDGELVGLNTVNKIHVELDPEYYKNFEVITVPETTGGCPFAYVFPNSMSEKKGDLVTFSLQMINQTATDATVSISSVCAKEKCIDYGVTGSVTCAGGRSAPGNSMAALGVFAVLGLLSIARPLRFSACLLVVILAVVVLSTPSSFFANSTDATNVVPDDGCGCETPYSPHRYYDDPEGVPAQLVLFHRPDVTVKSTKHSDGSWDINCDGGACLSQNAGCDMSANYGYKSSLPPHYSCSGVDGRPLTLNISHKATAATHWVKNSSWVAVDPTPTRAHSALDVAALLRGEPEEGCEAAADRLTRGQEWMKRGVDEFVSVGSFNRFSLDLMPNPKP